MLIGRERKQVKGRKTENSTNKITNYFSKTISNNENDQKDSDKVSEKIGCVEEEEVGNNENVKDNVRSIVKLVMNEQMNDTFQ